MGEWRKRDEWLRASHSSIRLILSIVYFTVNRCKVLRLDCSFPLNFLRLDAAAAAASAAATAASVASSAASAASAGASVRQFEFSGFNQRYDLIAVGFELN